MKGILAAFVVAGLAVGAAPAGAASLVLPRAGQVGIGIQGQFGSLLKTGELGTEFGSGGGVAVRLKYRMRYERAIGLSFDTQRLDARGEGAPAGAFLADTTGLRRDQLALNTAGFDVYQFFGTRTRTPKYLSAGIGMAQISARLSDGETQYPLGGDGLFLSVGAGLERFVYRSWAIDLGGRYQAVFLDNTTNHDIQVSLGMIFYAAY
jgi:opacity protein-like surface antigen